jgi:hypothetical protein
LASSHNPNRKTTTVMIKRTLPLAVLPSAGGIGDIAST